MVTPMDKARLEVRRVILRKAASESVSRAIAAHADGVMTLQAASEYGATHLELSILEWERAERVERELG